MKKHLISIAGIAGLTLFCSTVISVSFHACAPERLHQTDVRPQETSISIPAEDPCSEEHTINAQWCFGPDGGSWGPGWYAHCLADNSEESWSPENSTWSFRTTLPFCPKHFAITDSECEWLHEPYCWHADWNPVGQFWEVVVELPEEFTQCVEGYGTWCIEIEICAICSES